MNKYIAYYRQKNDSSKANTKGRLSKSENKFWDVTDEEALSYALGQQERLGMRLINLEREVTSHVNIYNYKVNKETKR